MAMYFTVLAIFLLGFLIVYRAIHSPFGQVLKAIRENEPRAVSLGYQAEHYKLIAFVLSATLAGLAGGTKSIVFQLASLTDVHWTMSGEVVLMTLLGGLGTVFGPVVGALALITLEHYLAQLGAWFTIVQGVIFVICVLTFRRGIVGELGHLLKKAAVRGGAMAAGSEGALDRLFRLAERGTTVRTEVRAGLTTFMVMAYIIFVNPIILGFVGVPGLEGKGLPFAATLTATCLTAGLLSIAMGAGQQLSAGHGARDGAQRLRRLRAGGGPRAHAGPRR